MKKWGGTGYGNGKFRYPGGITLDKSGNVYVADTWNNRIQKFDSNGNYLTEWGPEIHDKQFISPTGIVLDKSRNIYVIDTSSNRIGKFDPDGNFTKEWFFKSSESRKYRDPEGMALDSLGNIYIADSDNDRILKFDSNGDYLTLWGAELAGDGQFKNPYGIAINNLDQVYVADTDNDRIQKFDSNGNYLYQWGSEGTGNGQFNSPNGVAVDGSGYIYVTDTTNNRIQKFDLDSKYLTKWGTKGSGNGMFNSPRGITVDMSGDVFVADTNNHRIQKFDPSGKYITQWGIGGSNDGQLLYPEGIAIDNFGYVYIADTGNHRIQVFRQNGCIKGDANGDGSVKSNDAILALRISAGLITPTPEQTCSGDMNGDGSVKANDAIVILRKSAGLGAPSKDTMIAGKVTIKLDDINGISGESVILPLRVEKADILAGGDIILKYDSSVLQAVGVSSDSDMLLADNISEPGVVRIAFAGSVSEKLLNIIFKVLSDGISPLKFDNAELYNQIGTPISAQYVNKEFRSWAMPAKQTALLQNYPNPFNPDTWIPYQLEEDSGVIVRIYNVAGELVRELNLGQKQAGIYVSQDRSAYWDGRNKSGETVASGVYFVILKAGENYQKAQRIVLIK